MTPDEIAAIVAQAHELASAAALLRRATRAADDARAVKTMTTALVLICNAEGATRQTILDALDRMRDQQLQDRADRTAAAVKAMETAMRAAVGRMPDGPQD